MDIQKLDLKHKLLAGSAMAVISGFVPPIANQADAGTATMPVDVEIVTAVNVANTSGLDFGRLALTGAVTGSDHILNSAGATTTGVNLSVVTTGTPGSFDVTAGTLAANVQLSFAANVTYNAGNIVLNQVTFGGPALTAPVVVAGGGTATGALNGGGATDVQVGGRLNFVANPAVGNYTGNSASLSIIDIP